MNVALNCRQNHFAANARVRFIHMRLKVAYCSLHRLGTLKNLGDDEFVVVKKSADFVHAFHERTVDYIEWLCILKGKIQIARKTFFSAFDNIVRETLLNRE